MNIKKNVGVVCVYMKWCNRFKIHSLLYFHYKYSIQFKYDNICGTEEQFVTTTTVSVSRGSSRFCSGVSKERVLTNKNVHRWDLKNRLKSVALP
jgi:hypothetical protein